MRSLSDRRVAVICGVVAAIGYVVAGLGEVTPYDYYGRLAQALLHGRWWLDEAPPWLNELLACGLERWCVVYPPLPAILTVPFVLFLSAGAAQGLVAQLAGGASAAFLYDGLRALGVPRRTALVGTIASAFGTTLLFCSADGRVWFAAHSVATLFLCAAFAAAARGRGPVLLGALIGLAALARLPVAAAAPGLALLLALRGGRAYPATLARVVLGGLPFAAVAIAYDLLRWGSLVDGYSRLAAGDVFFEYGVFSPLYLPRHVAAIFFELPAIDLGTPLFLRPRFIGMSLFLTTPVFLWIFAGVRHLRRDASLAAVALAGGLALVPDLLHATVGFAQFGYRFSLDAQPFLVTLALAGDALRRGVWRERPSWPFIVAAAVSVAINVYAVVLMIHFGYWQ